MTNPPLLRALAAAGHGSKVLLADANDPATTAAGPRARLVELSIGRDLPTVTDLLRLILPIVPVEAVQIMAGPGEIPAHAEYASALAPLELESLERYAFYEAARSDDVAVVVTTGDTRLYANLMLTVGTASPCGSSIRNASPEAGRGSGRARSSVLIPAPLPALRTFPAESGVRSGWFRHGRFAPGSTSVAGPVLPPVVEVRAPASLETTRRRSTARPGCETALSRPYRQYGQGQRPGACAAACWRCSASSSRRESFGRDDLGVLVSE